MIARQLWFIFSTVGILLVVSCQRPVTEPRYREVQENTQSGSAAAQYDWDADIPVANEDDLDPFEVGIESSPSDVAGSGSESTPDEEAASTEISTSSQSSNVGSSVRSSKGSGGPTGFQEVSYNRNALRSRYKINAPADTATGKLYGLHVHLHGDGGGGYQDFPNRATRDGLIGVAVLSPNEPGRMPQWARGAPVDHADFLNELIRNELLNKYNIDRDRIYFSGVSGGAYFLSGYFLPKYGAEYKSGAFLMCGGMAPPTGFSDPSFLKDFRIHWQVTAGERPGIMNSVEGAMQAYREGLRAARGLSAQQSVEIKGSGGHCAFDGLSYTPGIQSMLDRRFNVILK